MKRLHSSLYTPQYLSLSCLGFQQQAMVPTKKDKGGKVIIFRVMMVKTRLVTFQLTPRAIACAIPNLGTFLAHRGLK